MIRRPPRSTPFPTRRSSDLIRTNKGAKNFRVVAAPVSDPSEKNWKEFVAYRPLVKIEGDTPQTLSNSSRSEEHTSELQSRQYLVCRLLLEKKKRTSD